jgi:hypothetical protein
MDFAPSLPLSPTLVPSCMTTVIPVSFWRNEDEDGVIGLCPNMVLSAVQRSLGVRQKQIWDPPP